VSGRLPSSYVQKLLQAVEHPVWNTADGVAIGVALHRASGCIITFRGQRHVHRRGVRSDAGESEKEPTEPTEGMRDDEGDASSGAAFGSRVK